MTTVHFQLTVSSFIHTLSKGASARLRPLRRGPRKVEPPAALGGFRELLLSGGLGRVLGGVRELARLAPPPVDRLCAPTAPLARGAAHLRGAPAAFPARRGVVLELPLLGHTQVLGAPERHAARVRAAVGQPRRDPEHEPRVVAGRAVHVLGGGRQAALEAPGEALADLLLVQRAARRLLLGREAREGGGGRHALRSALLRVCVLGVEHVLGIEHVRGEERACAPGMLRQKEVPRVGVLGTRHIKLGRDMLPCRAGLLLLVLVFLPARADAQALAGDLDLADAQGRVDACAAPLVAHNDTCTCDAGATWQSTQSGAQCVACAAGTYKTAPGFHACSACPALTTSFEGAAEAADCLCVPGFQNASEACAACAAGAYKEFIGNNSCVACPANANTSGVASADLGDCLCQPGYKAATGDEACAPCPRDTFTDEAGASACSPCPLNSGTALPASTSAGCLCLAGYTPATAGACTACAAGTYKPAMGMDTCSLCPDNMLSPSGATGLANCTCNAGYEKTGPGACAPCALDNYCPGADTKLACPGNSSAPRGAALVAHCTCLPGFFWYHATCEPCSEDHYCLNNTRTACPPNSTAPVASFAIDNCTCLPGFH